MKLNQKKFARIVVLVDLRKPLKLKVSVKIEFNRLNTKVCHKYVLSMDELVIEAIHVLSRRCF